MIKLKDITKIYKTKREDVIALNDLTIELPRQQFVLIKGPSGCGKSTLLFTLAGMMHPTSGAVNVLGKDLQKLNEKDRTHFLARKIGFVFQAYYLIPYLNVLENILLINQSGLHNIQSSEVKVWAKKLNIENRLDHFPSELSIGEKQRVALVRAFVAQPNLILADEPTGNLDPSNTQEVLKHLENYHREGGSVIMVSHSNEADEIADIIITMSEGRFKEITYRDKQESK